MQDNVGGGDTAVTPAVRLPPGPPLPRLVQGIGFSLLRRQMVQRLARRYGAAFRLNVPMFGPLVVVTDPRLAKQVFTSRPEVLGNIQPNLSRVLGPGSVFALDGDAHRARRLLLSPPFHGQNIKNYERIIEEETLAESATWPQGTPFATLRPMNRITLNVILRAVFGAEGADLDELREIIPPWVTLGSRLVALPTPKRTYGRYSPWGRLAAWRARYEIVVDRLIEVVRADPDFDSRTDMLSLLLRSSYEDGSAMSRGDIGDELLTFLAAGHETTASTLGWVFERISRDPQLLADLTAEADTGGAALRQATIYELQRNRTVIDFAGRRVLAPSFTLGPWVLPRDSLVVVSIASIHDNAEQFPDADRFDPHRFLDTRPSTFAWVPFGGGTRRCPGATFANAEMDVVLRTVLRHFTIEPSAAPGEKWHSRGVAFTPKDGGRIVVHRR
ncbi:cytochrome P450 [Mycolicibacillus koreensis]|nr:cytochrome P450 [Mycolicibacillus koreensis]